MGSLLSVNESEKTGFRRHPLISVHTMLAAGRQEAVDGTARAMTEVS